MEPFRFPYKVPCAAEQRAENRRMLECISRYMHFADADTVTPSAVAELAEVCGSGCGQSGGVRQKQLRRHAGLSQSAGGVEPGGQRITYGRG